MAATPAAERPGPILTRSKLVTADVDGDKIGPVVRNGRPDKGMPPFDRSDQQIASLVAFIHTQQANASRAPAVAEVTAVERAWMHRISRPETSRPASTTSTVQADAQAATRRPAISPESHHVTQASNLRNRCCIRSTRNPKVTVTLASGQTITGTLGYLDEFTVGLIDSTGTYRSWRTRDVQYKVDPPVNAHVELFSKYTDADIHNLMAYLQTLR